MAAVRRNLPKGQANAAASQAATVLATLRVAQLADARTQTLQHIPAPICRADLVNPQQFMRASVLLPAAPAAGDAPVTLPAK